MFFADNLIFILLTAGADLQIIKALDPLNNDPEDVMYRIALTLCVCLSVIFPAAAYAESPDLAGVLLYGSNMPTLTDIYNQLDSGTISSPVMSFQGPASGPTGGTDRSLSEIKLKLPEADNANGATAGTVLSGKTFWGLHTSGGTWGLTRGTMPNRGAYDIAPGTSDQSIPAGYHNGSGTVSGDPALKSGNIKCGVTIFGATGTYGRRFIDNGNGTVTDTNTNLVWLKNANCFGRLTWQQAMDAAAALSSGQCGLSDGSMAGQWRLPREDTGTLNEWRAFVNLSYQSPALSNGCGTARWTEGDVFNGIWPGFYWSSSPAMDYSHTVWLVNVQDGSLTHNYLTTTNGVWPVRPAQ
jgi:hypothetical protein